MKHILTNSRQTLDSVGEQVNFRKEKSSDNVRLSVVYGGASPFNSFAIQWTGKSGIAVCKYARLPLPYNLQWPTSLVLARAVQYETSNVICLVITNSAHAVYGTRGA